MKKLSLLFAVSVLALTTLACGFTFPRTSMQDSQPSNAPTPVLIPTAVNLPVDTIATTPPTPYLSTLIVVYCGSGARSAKARQALEALGYTRVVDFGAMGRWKGSSVTGGDPGECPCFVN